MDVEGVLSELQAATEGMERAQFANGDLNEMARAVAERANAVDRLAATIEARKTDFSLADLAELRELCARGSAVSTSMKQARRADFAAAAKIDGMRHVMNAFVPDL